MNIINKFLSGIHLITTLSAVITILISGQATAQSGTRETAPGFRPLFNGKNLNGWIARGGDSEFRVVDGSIVGTCIAGSPSTYLCTEESFEDFILELEFQVQDAMNSGVQIRTQVAAKTTQFIKPNGKKRTRKAGSIFGYQVEIDPTERAWTGGIYDQSRRGWLQTLEKNEAARSAFIPNQWNHLRIKCQGKRIQTWINGIQAADLHDKTDTRGVIGLQILGAGRHKNRIGATATFRNIQIKPLKQ